MRPELNVYFDLPEQALGMTARVMAKGCDVARQQEGFDYALAGAKTKQCNAQKNIRSR